MNDPDEVLNSSTLLLFLVIYHNFQNNLCMSVRVP